MGVKVLSSDPPRCEPSREVCEPDPKLVMPPEPGPGGARPPEWMRGNVRDQHLRGLDPPRATAAQPLDLSPDRLSAAIAVASQRLGSYLTTRSAGLDSPMMWVPYDGTRRFRLGDDGSDGFGFTAGQLADVTAELTARGFPRFVAAEARLVNVTNYAARLAAGEQVGLQHFPGGNPDLETTERVNVHYGDAAEIRAFVAPYADIIRANPPRAIMLSHATYALGGFPGAEVLNAGRDPRPGFLRDLPFNQIPASLNPTLISYLRQNLGYRGVVTPDWYDMGAVTKFIHEHANIDLGDSGDDDYRDRARAFILGVEAGVDFPTAIPPHLAGNRELWAAFERNHPHEYGAFLERLDERVRETYDRVRPSGGRAMDTSPFSFEDKVRLLIYNPRPQTNGSSYHADFADLRGDTGPRGELARPMLLNGTGDYDVWNRTGVLTMMLRQFVVESVTGQRWPALPADMSGIDAEERDALEENWFYTLANDQGFMRAYNAVPWDSPEMTALYQRFYQQAATRRPGLASHGLRVPGPI